MIRPDHLPPSNWRYQLRSWALFATGLVVSFFIVLAGPPQ